MEPRPVPEVLDGDAYIVEFEDRFEAAALDPRRWVPRYLPQWTTPDRAAARYDVGDGRLLLRIDADQPAWSPEHTGELRVSSLQTGVFAGPLGSNVGQHRFRADLVVRDPQPTFAGYTPRFGLFELRARFSDDPTTMAALWMIGFEEAPEQSGEICIVEIFGRDVAPERVGIGMGIHPLHDPRLHEEFAVEQVAIDAREPHWYAAEWTPQQVAFYVDQRLVKVVRQSPAYPMQLMLDIFEFREPPTRSAGSRYPKTFEVDAFRASTPPTRHWIVVASLARLGARDPVVSMTPRAGPADPLSLPFPGASRWRVRPASTRLR